MKHYSHAALIFFIGLFYTQISTAQVKYGIKAGLALPTQITSDESIESKSFVGFYGGGYLNINLGRNLSLQPELQYIMQGSNLISTNPNTTKTRISYLAVPLVFQYQIIPNLKLELGGMVSFPLNGTVKQGGQLIMDWQKKWDAGIVAGLSYTIPQSPISLDLRYYRGLANQSPETSQPKLFNRSLNLGASYKLK